MTKYLDFERPIAELESRISDLRRLSSHADLNIIEEVERLQTKAERTLVTTYKKLTAWQKVQVARHQDRPHVLEYILALTEDFTPLAGDRLFSEDHAMVGGLCRFRGKACVILGTEKGKDVDSRVHHNFGMARPEGYRKAMRLMRLADRFGLPVITLVDTPGAYPGVGAEERGQSEAIARSIETCLSLSVPLISVIIGEGGSGGAVALATANTILILEHAVYSVISPEGCASILWRDASRAQEASEALCLTAQDLLEHSLVDTIVPEPLGGAHREPGLMIDTLGQALEGALTSLLEEDSRGLKKARREKFLSMTREH